MLSQHIADCGFSLEEPTSRMAWHVLTSPSYAFSPMPLIAIRPLIPSLSPERAWFPLFFCLWSEHLDSVLSKENCILLKRFGSLCQVTCLWIWPLGMNDQLLFCKLEVQETLLNPRALALGPYMPLMYETALWVTSEDFTGLLLLFWKG